MTTSARPALTETVQAMPPADRKLLETARSVLASRYAAGRHEVAAAARLASGQVVTGLHVEASQGRASVCAESGVLSAAAVAGEEIVGLVAVLRRPDGAEHLIEPCGVCAEILADHCPDAAVWAARRGATERVAAADLLPFRHVRTARLAPPRKDPQS
ncbi:cytidine deaminase [Cellulosimicrobium sp. CUA-896]|uniref:cytidine deaminase n=1 Tax=Cellulosimicrobium sp. CUA-896 TaxID=1517881 RepID=UPI0013017E83|nr:cytidine deaminase [Cellulosimicrobium sp. CUA-896]